jgi:thymidine kinase
MDSNQQSIISSSSELDGIVSPDKSQIRNELSTSGERSSGLHRGTLVMRIGPMFSSKTTWLNHILTEFADKDFSVLKITHYDDIRSDVAMCDDSGSTHNSSYTSLSPKVKRLRAMDLTSIDVTKYHTIGIDEAHFFSDLKETVESWVENLGKHVRLVGLDGTFARRKFGQVLDLIPLADNVKKLSADCRPCLNELKCFDFHGNISGIKAPFTKRLVVSNDEKLIGGSDIYIPVCRYHYSLKDPN